MPVAVRAEEGTETWTVIFNPEGGNCDVSEVRVPKGGSVTLPDITYEGYRFGGWIYVYEQEPGVDKFVNIGFAGESFTPTVFFSDIHASWHKEFTLAFDACGGECAQGSMTVIKTDSVTLPEASREGYEFTGWYGDEGLTEYAGAAGDAYSTGEDKTLYAGWKEEEKEKQKFTIVFDVPEGECDPKSVEVEEGESVTLPEATREGYVFTGWYGDEDLTEYIGAAGEAYTPDEGKTLHAGWKEEEKEKKKYTIVFDVPEGECDPKSVEVEEGESVTLPEARREGYEFTGWYGDEDLAEYIGAAGEAYTPDEGKTLYAGWKEEEEEKKKYIIIFDVPEGECDPKSVEVEEGESVTLPEARREGYEFTGWYGNEALTDYIGAAGEAWIPDGGKTLYPGWKKAGENTGGDETDPGQDKGREVMVAFETGGGSKAAPVKAVKGSTIKLPSTEKKGFSFLGWYTQKDGGTFLGAAGDGLKVSGDMTLYALWEKKQAQPGEDKAEGSDTKQEEIRETCTAVFHTGRGSLTATEVTAAKGASLYLPLPVCEGYEFTGWYLDEALTQFAGAGGQPYRITGDACFYAGWRKAGENNKTDGAAEGGKGDTGREEKDTASPGTGRAETESGTGHGTDISPAGGQGDGKGTADTGRILEPVIQTGRISPVPVFYGLGLTGLFLMLSALASGEKGRHGRR